MATYKEQKGFSKPQDSGYTILEAIMAVIVVSVLMIAIAPVVAFSTATRVQARRVELATQAGKTYIDGVRSWRPQSGVTVAVGIDPPGLKANLPLASSNEPAARTAFISAVAPPNAGELSGNCLSQDGYCGTDKTLYCVNLDDTPGCQTTSPRDMVVQPFRSIPPAGPGILDPEDPGRGYVLVVRVYRADSFAPEVGTLNINIPITNVTNAVGNRNSPVVQMVTEIGSTADAASPYQGFCQRVGCQ